MKITLKASLLAMLAAGRIATADPPAAATATPPAAKVEAKAEGAATETKACLDECTICGPRVWASSDYLLWRIKDAPIPQPLITVNAGGFPALGTPGTQLVYGEQDQSMGWFSGGRLTLGGWLNEAQTIGLEGSAFLLEERSAGMTVQSDDGGNPFLGTPLFFPLPQGGFFSSAEPISIPELIAATASVVSTSQLWGAEANLVARSRQSQQLELRGLAGFRFLSLEEGLSVVKFQRSLVQSDGFQTVADQFGTQNRFYGGQLGGQARYTRGRLYLEGIAKVALGATMETVSLSGVTNFTLNGQAGGFPNGVLVRPSNAGTSSNTRFAVAPEVAGRIGVNLTDNVTAFVGYTFLYWSDVARPGEQVDVRSSPVGPFPARTGATTDVFVHGLNFGGEIRF